MEKYFLIKQSMRLTRSKTFFSENIVTHYLSYIKSCTFFIYVKKELSSDKNSNKLFEIKWMPYFLAYKFVLCIYIF